MWLPYMVAPQTVKMEGARYGAVRLIYAENPELVAKAGRGFVLSSSKSHRTGPSPAERRPRP
jgi:hypothetical protein